MSQTRSVSSPAEAEAFRDSILRHVRYSLGREWSQLTGRELFEAVSFAVRDRIVDLMVETEARIKENAGKRVFYLSMEFLMGRSLGNNLHNLGLWDVCRDALDEMGVDIEEIAETEVDAALGNGGLGRLAACFLDSLASLGLPGYGYGINYEYGLFRQELDNGWQKEKPDSWRALGTPWQFERREEAVVVPLFGELSQMEGHDGIENSMWLGWDVIVGVPHDMPVVGYGGKSVNTLRLYSARATDEFDMSIFNEGDYVEAVKQKMESETISKVLYPPDSDDKGRELRLIQEYFFTSCAVQSIVRNYLAEHGDLANFADKIAIQLNDTHPALAVAELMRVLMDEHSVEWDEAWDITRNTLAYTNHTLLPEALERWSRELVERVLPRHLQIIEQIDAQFLAVVEQRFPGDTERKQRMAIVNHEGEQSEVRMAHLAIVGSHSVNGVAELHSELVKSDLVPDFHELWPERFNNKTNGVTQRRWLHQCNPGLRDLINEAIGPEWVTDLDRLRELEPFAEDAAFRERFLDVKLANKQRLARTIAHDVRVDVDPASLFDVQAKRIHEYKRQLLLALYAVHSYLRIVEDGVPPASPRTIIFAGKAAPGYWAAKQQIKLINSIGRVINHDPRCAGLLKVVFIPDYRVSLAEQIMPAADLSEQISTAGMEASGTGNMKFALNGALTIGTLDGANIEIREEVGDENIFIFGLLAEDIARQRADGSYNPRAIYENNAELSRVLDALSGARFSPGDPRLFHWLKETLLDRGDYFFNLADFADYIATQDRVSHEFQDTENWSRKAILNVARMGKFSSDRTISEYARDIWGLLPSRTVVGV
ncbi:MAG: alpha-1,4 glucan phosphorylase [Planctomycetota bacterium]|nr:MAG: alpha-1,4 glucan phosphorylase [Planctomycetota bacterium]